MVAGQDQATQDAYTQATTQGQGIGAYAPYLQSAGQYQTGTGTFAGLPTNMMGAQDLTGPNAYQQFMSPYQQDVIDATLSEYDKQAQAGITNIGLGAAQSGNLGGGREGVMRAQYQNQSDMNRALLQSQMLQGGFQNAQQAANQAFTQTQQLGADQQRMATLLPQLHGSEIFQHWVKLGAANNYLNNLSLINKEKLTDLQLTNHTKDLVTWVLVWVTLWVVLWVSINHKLHLINRRCSRR